MLGKQSEIESKVFLDEPELFSTDGAGCAYEGPCYGRSGQMLLNGFQPCQAELQARYDSHREVMANHRLAPARYCRA